MKRLLILAVLAALSASAAETAPASTSREELDFSAALSRILERSTLIATQQATLDAREALNLPARFFYLPSIQLTGKRVLIGSEFEAADSFGNSLFLSANVNLFRFGSDVAGLAAANSDERAERAQLANDTLTAEQDGVAALTGYISAVQEVSVSKKSLGLQEELIRIGRARYDRGLLPMQEVDKLAIDLENIRSTVADSEIRLVEASARLDALLGGPRIAASWPWKTRFLSEKPAFAEGAGNVALASRPDLQAAEARLDAEARRYWQRMAAVLPTIDLNYEYGHSSGALRAAREDGHSWAGALVFNIPLLSRLTDQSAASAQAHVREAAELRLEQSRREARQDLEGARSGFEISRQSVLAREKALEVSGKVYGDSLRRFQLGRLDANALTVDQARLFSAELNAVHGWATLHAIASRLCHAQGLRLADCLK